MTHQGLPVAGYRPQNDLKIDLVNRNKANEERQLRLMEIDKDAGDVDGRWLALAKTHLEQAFMAWNRAIFQPGRVSLPEDVPEPPAAESDTAAANRMIRLSGNGGYHGE